MIKTIDATGLILGRIATNVAKRTLMGETVQIINCEKAAISGSKSKIDKVKKLRSMGSPFHGPFYPKAADRIVKRTIRGMLPYKQERGRKALERVKCYIGAPEELDIKEMISIPGASKEKITAIKTFTVKALSTNKKQNGR
jgi:large subunit ribosomal protein L13